MPVPNRSKRTPFLSIARWFSAPYGDVLMFADDIGAVCFEMGDARLDRHYQRMRDRQMFAHEQRALADAILAEAEFQALVKAGVVAHDSEPS